MTEQDLEEYAAPTRRDWFGLATLSVGLGVIVLDGTIVGVALPDIVRDLGLDLTQAQWVNSLYAVILAGLLLVTGKLADRFGRRNLFLVGVVVFMVGSLLAALSDTANGLIGARAVQALGAAAIMPSTLSTVNTVFRGKYRAAAFGVWGAVISGAAAVGPLAGGALTQYASWQWIFLVNLPIGVLVIVAALLTVPATKGEVHGKGADVDGALLSAIGLAALVFAVIEGPDLGWWSPKADARLFGFDWPVSAPVSPVPVFFAIGLAALALFVVWEGHRRRVGRSALLDLELFSLPTFRWGLITAAAVAVGEFAIVFVLPLHLVNALGLSLMNAGWVLAAMALGAFFSGAQARHLAARMGAPGVVVLGLALELVGVLTLVLLLRPDSAGWLVALPLVVYGLGLGLASAQLTGTVLSEVPTAESGQASATQSAVRQLGSAWGTAVAGTALAVGLGMFLPAALDDAGVPAAQQDQFVTATTDSVGSNIPGTAASDHPGAAKVAEALSQGFTDATRLSLGASAVFLVLGLGGAIAVRRRARP